MKLQPVCHGIVQYWEPSEFIPRAWSDEGDADAE
jgi:hypothetical protein